MLPARTAVLISIAIGVALEVGVIPPRAELPVAVLLAAAMGYVARGRGWLAPALIGPAEFVAALYRGASLASSWLGPFVYYLALSVPLVLASFVGRRLRNRRR